MTVHFGVFDHLDRKNVPLAQLYEERLQLIAEYDRAGFYAYHLAEHQCTPLGLAPSPGIFLSSVAQRTKRLRFGPLVYVLPLYNPLRLAAEICMLDHLSGGRLELGVGRGISPFEVTFYGVSYLETADMFREAFEVLRSALTGDVLRHRGTFYKFLDAPIVLKPLQMPHPPIWYGIGSRRSAEWAARNGMNVVSNASCGATRAALAAYRDAARAPAKGGTAPKLGMARHVYVAETDSEAEGIARRAVPAWFENLSKLWRDNGGLPTRYSGDVDELKRQDAIVVGTPATVKAEIERHISATGCNYFVGRFAYGDLTLEESLRSLALFTSEVMPHFGEKSKNAVSAAPVSG